MTSDEQKLARQLELYKQENIVLELPRFGKRIKATYGIDNSDNWRTRLLEHDSVELGWDQLNLVIQSNSTMFCIKRFSALSYRDFSSA